jgi:uncharacterized membrane protein
MARTTTWANFLLVCLALSVSAVAQAPASAPSTTSQAPAAPKSQGARIQNFNEVKEPNPPDMVCFGYGPKWSVQFTDGAARYLGVNQPNDDFLGTFYWDSEMKVWNWHRENGLEPMNGSFGLSATIQKQTCTDRNRGETYQYSSQVNLPTGDMVSGCCRRLKAGEAAIGKHGLQQTAGANGAVGSAPAGSPTQPAAATQPATHAMPPPASGKPKAGIPSAPQ